jgi:hypothetical protein
LATTGASTPCHQSGSPLDQLDVLIAEDQRLEAQAPARPILNLAATDRVDHLAVGDREQPRKRGTALRSIARKRRERSREMSPP